MQFLRHFLDEAQMPLPQFARQFIQRDETHTTSDAHELSLPRVLLSELGYFPALPALANSSLKGQVAKHRVALTNLECPAATPVLTLACEAHHSTRATPERQYVVPRFFSQ